MANRRTARRSKRLSILVEPQLRANKLSYARALTLPELTTRADIDCTAQAMRERGRHIGRVSWQGQAAWLKLSVPQPPAWRYQLLAAVARSLRLAAVLPVRPLGGARGLAIEAARITALKQSGLHTPELVSANEDWLLMSDIGEITLEKLIREAAPSDRLRYWQLGADYLIAAHHAGQYLSQAFCRNFVWSEQGLGAIDFEDDACAVMSLADAQVRDWLPYCFSTAHFFANDLGVLQHTLAEVLERESPAVRVGVWRAFRRTAWLRMVRFLPSPMQRRDVVNTRRYGELAARLAGR